MSDPKQRLSWRKQIEMANVVILTTTLAGAVLSSFLTVAAVAAGAWAVVVIFGANCAIDVMIAVDTYGEMRQEARGE